MREPRTRVAMLVSRVGSSPTAHRKGDRPVRISSIVTTNNRDKLNWMWLV
jgi:hypothetical protein